MRQHDHHQEVLPGTDPSAPLTSWQQASSVVGEFFELLTARMVDGYRCAVDGLRGENPDVVAGDRHYESKAAGRQRWLLEEHQTRAFAADPRGRYVLWTYTTPGPGGLVAHGTAHALRAWLACHITGCYVMPSHYPLLLLAGTPHAEPRRAKGAGQYWGSNWWFRTHYLYSVLDGSRDIDARFAVRYWPMQLVTVAGVKPHPFLVTWLFDLPDAITALDQALAVAALEDLETKRLRVELVPCDHGSGMKRVATARNAEWYREFIDRRRIPTRWRDRNRQVFTKRGRSSGRRQHVRRALERIRDNDPPPQRNWIGWELIELLRDHDARARARDGQW